MTICSLPGGRGEISMAPFVFHLLLPNNPQNFLAEIACVGSTLPARIPVANEALGIQSPSENGNGT